jgi:ribosomal protein S8
MFPSPDTLMPGEVVVFGDASQQVKRSTTETYSRTIAGIVSTSQGIMTNKMAAEMNLGGELICKIS